MKTSLFSCILLLLLCGCKNTTHTQPPADTNIKISLANKFVDAFYSFNRDTLQSMLSLAPESQPNILYYQKWAECAHYKIVKRGDFVEKNDSLVLLPITVKDDLMGALQIDFNVTDTFHLAIRDGQILSVQTSSNDLAEYYAAKEWVKKNRPEYVEKACEGIWEGGPTPCECVQGMVKGFGEFTASKK
ncbi:hypothetical protein [Chryseolinea lacunae]|uniref:Lipoprotein n=1 Tax=Chryseolinea lacunae TaxID=2801331 RepID=A0ABS1L1M0_9BACT|nr:hypothetical protein [Chryseolinea lacunae]MBL0745549.1 hypothetical protein [Chryseolinea lacunae]